MRQSMGEQCVNSKYPINTVLLFPLHRGTNLAGSLPKTASHSQSTVLPQTLAVLSQHYPLNSGGRMKSAHPGNI